MSIIQRITQKTSDKCHVFQFKIILLFLRLYLRLRCREISHRTMPARVKEIPRHNMPLLSGAGSGAGGGVMVGVSEAQSSAGGMLAFA